MTLQALYQEMELHLLRDGTPSYYLNKIAASPLFGQHPFTMLKQLRQTEQSPQHHPEGNVWNHTMLVVDEAARVRSRSKRPAVFMWAALLHDIGKPPTTRMRKGRITAYDHDKVGSMLAKEFLQVFSADSLFISQVSALIRYHMHILYVLKDLPFADLAGMLRSCDIQEVTLLCLCDRLGRTKVNREEEENNVRLFLQKCLGEN